MTNAQQRYGYYLEDENYSDVAEWTVVATCKHCGVQCIVAREDAEENERGNLIADCMCSEN